MLTTADTLKPSVVERIGAVRSPTQPPCCFHCEEPIPKGLSLTIHYNQEDQPLCCAGCQAVAQLIISGGQGDYYRYRDAPASRPELPASGGQWDVFDQQQTPDVDGFACTTLWIDGIHCGACGWLIEHQLAQLDGVTEVTVDQQTGITRCTYQTERVNLSEIFNRIEALGYHPHPLDDDELASRQTHEKSLMLKQLALAGLGMMQISMFAISTYFGPAGGMDPAIERLLHLVSMLVATPVVFYSGASFFSGAWRSLKVGQLNMDVPVSLALLLAYGASVANFFRAAGPIYFESATMFVFLLLSARFVAMGVRHRAVDAQRALLPMLPDSVLRLNGLGVESVPRSAIAPGDLIRVTPGDRVAADGVIERGISSLNEALLTGESAPRCRSVGDAVLAGSSNIDGSIDVRVIHTGQDCSLAKATSLLDRARASRPRHLLIANRVSAVFVAAVLLVACAVFFWWLPTGFEMAFSATLAVLVVTCPCALSLAIPAALSAATTRLARNGLLVSRLDALQVLPNVTCMLMDKTGTLTEGRPSISEVAVNRSHSNPVNESELLELMAALEQHSNHPLASAFSQVTPTVLANTVVSTPGQGLSGRVEGRRLRLGNAKFVQDSSGLESPLILADDDGILGWADVMDSWRCDTIETVNTLNETGYHTVIVSGDGATRVATATAALGMNAGFGELTPAAKLKELEDLQASGHTVLALGDGVNDSGLLGGADVSVALADGADLAQASADVILTGQKLNSLLILSDVAIRTRHIIRQNLTWAVAYNLLAVPFAAAGMIGPGIAALGMSVSSLVVVLNAQRLARS